MQIGILGLQGAVEQHRSKLTRLGAQVTVVRRPEHIEGLAGMILPGGESSTMLRLLGRNELLSPLINFCKVRPTWGLCAGAILLAKTVTNPSQSSLGLMEFKAIRNAYGRQLDSFISELTPLDPSGWNAPVEGVFIRAPRFEITEPDEVKTIFTCKNEPVMIRQGHLLAASFHPELSQQDTLHQYFLDVVNQYL